MELDTFLIFIVVIYTCVLILRCAASQLPRRNDAIQEIQPINQINEIRRIIRKSINVIILTNDNQMEIGNEDDSDIENQIGKCSICHGILDHLVVKTECNHRYHKACLLNWIGSGQRRSLKCPLCVQSLSL